MNTINHETRQSQINVTLTNATQTEWKQCIQRTYWHRMTSCHLEHYDETHNIRGHFVGGQMKIKLFAQMYNSNDSLLLLFYFWKIFLWCMISKYLQILQACKILENIGLDGRNLVLAQIPDGHKKGITDIRNLWSRFCGLCVHLWITGSYHRALVIGF